MVTFLKHLDKNVGALQEAAQKSSGSSAKSSEFRKIGDQLASKVVLQNSIADGKCFQVS